MKKNNERETEKFLAAFSLKPTPKGFKKIILDGALQKQNSNHEMASFLKGFVVCIILLFIVIAVDAAITRAENSRFSSFLDQQQKSTENAEEEWSMLKDIIWEPSDSNKSEAKMKFYDLLENTKNKKRLPEWRESLEKEIE